MTERGWLRGGAWAGLVTAALMLLGLLLIPVPTGMDTTDAVARYFAGNHAAIRLTVVLVTVAAVVFLWFVGCLRRLLAHAEHGSEAFSPTVLAAGTAFAVMVLVHMVPAAALALLARRTGDLDGAVVDALYEAYVASLGMVGLLAALFVGTVSIALAREGIARPWQGWFGMIIAALTLVCGLAAFFVTGPNVMVVAYVIAGAFIVWLATTSLTLRRGLVRPGPAE